MKYIVLLGDGMSDEAVKDLDGKTPLQAAKTPHMDVMARRGRIGLAHTVPKGLPPGSDVANLSVFGYDPRTCYTGRSPLEAASMGVQLGPDDVAFRVNLVNLLPTKGTLVMNDYSAGHISTEEGRELIEAIQQQIGDDEFQFYPGVGYRHLMVWRNGKSGMSATPPHDISGKSILDYLPKGEGADKLIYLMNSSQMILNNHPQYRRRLEADKIPANSIWLWGHGKAPRMEPFKEKFGLAGAVISAVDLINGIGIGAGLDVIRVEGATGYLDTNYEGKVQAALEALETHDYVYLHVEAPDEASHSGNLSHKLQAIEDFDARVVGPIMEGIRRFGSFRILCTPDHPTPLRLKTHTGAPVPFIIYDGGESEDDSIAGYDEDSARTSGLVLEEGHRLMELLLER
ncbi:phosphonopyruvate decarboxylase-related protein [Geobacter metallireducens RCH3]|uniref:Phosphoglycerate mutase family protein n=1 Tax=Geobacter metallireducens (strain ATCC 53774 / DSM 7210 / GS-15) TaxID=269799 RepID=Q39VR2_GEOMG|nr:cofactor-independent phosphoglycerate mutase [Geobacter metallireducens]ABB31662.1 phosphoglycerate mutase family protein [Geobacter metallireducens GS-15]EHP89461.1 phosphonopyruvate decarboxylase-related protein [Geobacter metallireducens RCH3]